MINEIIELLPSTDLKAKIKETNFRFNENELLQMIYRYVPTLDARIDMLERFSGIAAPEVSALAKVYIEYEQRKLKQFTDDTEGFIFELCIKETPDSYEEKYLCSSYHAALACIDRFYEEYADINVKETERTRYRILKRKIFSGRDGFEEDTYGECMLGPGKAVKTIWLYKDPTECDLDVMCSECKEICPCRCDKVGFPCFVRNYALVKYQDYEGQDRYGINICWCECEGMAHELYVVPLRAAEIREHRFDTKYFDFDHVHIELPLATLASPDELDDTMRKNYFDFVSYWSLRTQSSDENGIAKCDECGSEYLAATSKMASLCPECAHVLYGYENCDHVFKDGKCTLCLWDGSRSNYIISLKQDKENN